MFHVLHFCGFIGYRWGKTNIEKTSMEFFDVFVLIWVWKSSFNSWIQNFWKCTLFAGNTVLPCHQGHIKLPNVARNALDVMEAFS